MAKSDRKRRPALLNAALTGWAAASSSSSSSTATTAFVVPRPLAMPSGRRGLLRSHACKHANTARFDVHSALRPKKRHVVGVKVGPRPRAKLTQTSMSFGMGGGRGGGPKGPLGFDLQTLVVVGFWLLLFFAPGVIFGAFNTLFLVITVGPLLLSVGVNIYQKINTIEAPCPVCGVQLRGLKSSQNQCPSCGTMVVAEKGKFEALGSGYIRDEMGTQQEFSRTRDSGVIDVDVIDIDD